MTGPVLVSAGEPSGDRMLARAAAALDASQVRLFGMGGAASRAAGVEIIASCERLGVMGLVDVVSRAWVLARTFARLQDEVRQRKPTAALLVGFTEFHTRLGRWLRSQGVRVLWCGAPQVWAWRPARLRTLLACLDRLAVVLPFEQQLWREHGYDAQYVGHPALDVARWPPPASLRHSVAVLCGSRDGEARRLGPMLIEAAKRFVTSNRGWQATLVLAPSLSQQRASELTQAAHTAGLQVQCGDPLEGAATTLHMHDLALSVSGTACLEAALSGALPIAVYRFDWFTAWAARKLVKTQWVSLPNIVLNAPVFPELLQKQATVDATVYAAQETLARRDELVDACGRLRAAMMCNDGVTMSFGQRVAQMLRPWIGS